MTQLKRILVPTDFSDHSERAAAYAVELAKRYEAEIVHCVHVSDIPADLLATSSYYMTGPSEEFLEQVRDRGPEEPGGLRGQAPAGRARQDGVPGGPARSSRSSATPAKTRSTSSSSRRTGGPGIKHALFGSVAEKVVRKAPCPVLVVKRDERDFVMP